MRIVVGDIVWCDVIEEDAIVYRGKTGTTQWIVWNELEKRADVGRDKALPVKAGHSQSRGIGPAARRQTTARAAGPEMDSNGWEGFARQRMQGARPESTATGGGL